MILDVNLIASSLVVCNWSVKNCCAKVDEPTGVPSSLNPSVSSIGVVDPSLFGLLEYLAMVSAISCARPSSTMAIDGMMLSPEHDVSILVL